jgi:hypothetical protein
MDLPLPPLAVAPAAGFMSLLATVGLCYNIYRNRLDENYNKDIVFPAISELGALGGTGKLIYQIGFCVVGGMIALVVYQWKHEVVPVLLSQLDVAEDDAKPTAARDAFFQAATQIDSVEQQGYQAAFGVALQGLFTLETTISLQCFVHWAGAAAGIQGAMTHHQLSNALYLAAMRHEEHTIQTSSSSEAAHHPLFESSVGGVSWLGASAGFRVWIVENSGGLLFILPFVTQIVGVAVGHFAKKANATGAGFNFACTTFTACTCMHHSHSLHMHAPLSQLAHACTTLTACMHHQLSIFLV